MWIICILLGSLLLLKLNISFSNWDITLINTLKLTPVIILANYLYWVAFQRGPTIFVVWIIATGCISVLSFLYSIYFDNQLINLKLIVGSLMILLGSYILTTTTS